MIDDCGVQSVASGRECPLDHSRVLIIVQRSFALSYIDTGHHDDLTAGLLPSAGGNTVRTAMAWLLPPSVPVLRHVTQLQQPCIMVASVWFVCAQVGCRHPAVRDAGRVPALLRRQPVPDLPARPGGAHGLPLPHRPRRKGSRAGQCSDAIAIRPRSERQSPACPSTCFITAYAKCVRSTRRTARFCKPLRSECGLQMRAGPDTAALSPGSRSAARLHGGGARRHSLSSVPETDRLDRPHSRCGSADC